MNIQKILGALLIFNVQYTVPSFKTLTDLQRYAHTIQEFPTPDNSNWNNPIFDSYYETLRPHFMKRLLDYFNISDTDSLNLYTFHDLLFEQVKLREQQNLPGRQVARLLINEPISLYVFGDIQGEFHSLLRSLTFLKEQQIIDDSLTIIRPHTYIIFNGNFIDRAPYSIECLYTIMLLLKQNEEQVFYIRGTHEDNDYWHNFGLKRELMHRAGALLPFNASADAIPLGDLIDRFFNTLPLALYVATKDTPLDVIRISHVDRSNPELNEEYFGDFFIQNNNQNIHYFDVRQKQLSHKIPSIKALLTAEDWIREHRAVLGLGHLDQDLGTTSWSIVSAPILAYKNYYKFHYDAFAVIDVNIPIATSSITLWNNNIKHASSFVKQEAYNLTTGMPVTGLASDYATKPEIVFGSSMSLNRGVANMGHRVKRGMDIRINEQNNIGGIHGQRIKTIVYNDDYTPFLARQNIINLIEKDNTRLMLLPIGSQTLMAFIDYIQKNLITVLFPVTGTAELRNPDLLGIINYRPTHADEIDILLDYLFTSYGARKFLFFYQDDSYGRGALEQAHNDLKARGITDWIDVPYARGETNFEKQAQTIRSAQVDAIGLFSTAKATEELMRQVGIDALSNKKIFGISFLGEISFREYVKNHGLHILLGAAVPDPVHSNLEVVINYRKAMDANNLPYDVFSLESFITTSLLISVMERIKGPITREKIVEKLESFYKDKFQGLTLTYNPKTRSLARYVWIEVGENKPWIEREIKNILA